ncbi:MAG: metallophosphoesterase [Candidatus Hinthialibacter antarcticus]|nr:metallophosphoesterase [Candidatus Hinthialibacter antarcticus]
MRRFHFFLMVVLATVLAYHAVGQDDADQKPPYFTIVLMPDTQFYSEKFPHLYQAQCQWIRDNAESQNIQFVIHLGDIVQNRNENEDEWKIARDAHRLLDGVVPYTVAPGNHDQDVETRDSSFFNKYFPASDYETNEWYGGRMGDDNDNNYCFLDVDGLKFMIVNLEYEPSDEILAWADGVMKQHPDRRVIVATHKYMSPQGRNDAGVKVWEQLVKTNDNIFMVVCGHVGALSLQTSINDAGGVVYEILTDFQSMGEEGGGGWLRRLQFYPKVDRIVAYDTCVVDGNSKLGDIFHNYRLHYDMTD